MAIGGHIIEVLWLQMWLIIVRTASHDWPARELFIIGRVRQTAVIPRLVRTEELCVFGISGQDVVGS